MSHPPTVQRILRLHQTWQEEGRHHAGLLALYQANNPQCNMTLRRAHARSAGSYARDCRSRTCSIICICGASPPAAHDSENC
jgi:hypothetical protein